MLGLYGIREIKYIFDQDDEGPVSRAIDLYKKRPSFFTPYKKVSHFVGELIAPAIYPVAGTVISACSLIAAIGSALCFSGSLLMVGVSYLCGQQALYDDSLLIAGYALNFFGVCLVASAVAMVFGVLSGPHSLLSLITRPTATIISAATGCHDGNEEDDYYDYGFYDEDEHACCSL
jgi:hypothetical protein